MIYENENIKVETSGRGRITVWEKGGLVRLYLSPNKRHSYVDLTVLAHNPSQKAWDDLTEIRNIPVNWTVDWDQQNDRWTRYTHKFQDTEVVISRKFMIGGK